MNIHSFSVYSRRSLLLAIALCAIAPSSAQEAADFATPARRVDFLHMDLRLTLTARDIQARQMHGIVTYKMRVKQAGADETTSTSALKVLPLEAIGLEIAKVELASTAAAADSDFNATTFEATGKRLLIDLDPPMAPGSEFTARITYTVKHPRLGLHFVLPSADRPDKPTMVYSQSEPLEARYWLPCHDWPDTRWPSDVFITVPTPLRAVCVGEPIGEPLVHNQAGEELATYHWRQSEPIDPHILGFAVGELSVTQGEWRGRPVLVYAPPRYAKAARYTFRRTADMLEYYSRLTGVDYPYPRFAHVVVEDHFHGGMEHAGLDFLRPTMLTESDRNGDVPLDGSQFNYIAHMLGHQWFGGITNYQRITEAWLNEAFGTYLHQLWHTQAYSYDPPAGEPAPGRVSADWFYFDMWRTAQRIAIMDRPGSAPLVNEEITDPEQIYRFGGGKIYWKGAWVLHMLRHELGDDVFWAAIKQYLTKQRGQSVETADLRAALEEASGRDLKPFFEQWVYRGGTPHLAIGYKWDESRSVAVVTVKQTQRVAADNPPFQFPLDLYFRSPASERHETVNVNQANQTFEFASDEKPTQFCIDPRGGLLKSVKQSKPAVMWLEQARRGPTALARAIAIDRIKTEEFDGALEVLDECLSDETLFWGARRRAADGLAGLGTRAAREPLVKIAGQPRTHPRVLASVLRGIAEIERSPRVHALLLRHAGADAHMLPRAAAIRGLSRYPADDGLRAETVRKLERAALPPNGRYVREAAIRALQRVHDEQTFDWLLRHTASGADDRPALRARLTALLVAVVKNDEPHRSAVVTHLASLLDEGDIRVKTAALTGLGTLGDESILPRLEAFTAADQAVSVRHAAQAAIRKIQNRSGK